MGDIPIKFRERVEDIAARGTLGLALRLPYATRVRLLGWVFSRVVAPLAGWHRRIDENLKHALPDLTFAERQRLLRRVPDNVGRALIEIYSGDEFLTRVQKAHRTGPGLAALEAARADGKPIVLVTAHFANFDAWRGPLVRSGYPMAALYKPMKNRAFNEHYVKALASIGDPMYPTDARGIGALTKHLKDGGIIAIAADVASKKAPVLTFFGKPAHTPLSTAKWALKYNAVMFPVFAIRQENGLDFEIRVENPIQGDTPEAMMQAYNDAVERIVREHPEQWLWSHKRWKLSDWAKQGHKVPPGT